MQAFLSHHEAALIVEGCLPGWVLELKGSCPWAAGKAPKGGPASLGETTHWLGEQSAQTVLSGSSENVSEFISMIEHLPPVSAVYTEEFILPSFKAHEEEPTQCEKNDLTPCPSVL